MNRFVNVCWLWADVAKTRYPRTDIQEPNNKQTARTKRMMQKKKKKKKTKKKNHSK